MMNKFTVYIALDHELSEKNQSRTIKQLVTAKTAAEAYQAALERVAAGFGLELKKLTGVQIEERFQCVCVLQGHVTCRLRNEPPDFEAADTYDALKSQVLAARSATLIEELSTHSDGLLFLEGFTANEVWYQVCWLTAVSSFWKVVVLEDGCDRDLAEHVYRKARTKLNLMVRRTGTARSLSELKEIMASEPLPLTVVQEFTDDTLAVAHLQSAYEPERHRLFRYVRTEHGWKAEPVTGPGEKERVEDAFWDQISYKAILYLGGLNPNDCHDPDRMGYYNGGMTSYFGENARAMPEYEAFLKGALEPFDPLRDPLNYPLWFMNLWFGEDKADEASRYSELWFRFEALLQKFLWLIEEEEDACTIEDPRGNPIHQPDEGDLKVCWCQIS